MREPITLGGVAFDPRLTLVIILTTVVPMLDAYDHVITGTKAYDRLVLYFLIPLIVIVVVFRDRLQNYGFRLGQWREGLVWVVVGWLVMGLILWFIARTPSMQAYYRSRAPESVLRLLWLNGVDLFAWEFIWRGFLLFALARVLGPGPAIFLQAVPFAFMHLGKPELETLTTIFGGAAFGWIAWRTQSFVYPFLIHWFMLSFTMLVAAGRIG